MVEIHDETKRLGVKPDIWRRDSQGRFKDAATMNARGAVFHALESRHAPKAIAATIGLSTNAYRRIRNYHIGVVEGRYG